MSCSWFLVTFFSVSFLSFSLFLVAIASVVAVAVVFVVVVVWSSCNWKSTSRCAARTEGTSRVCWIRITNSQAYKWELNICADCVSTIDWISTPRLRTPVCVSRWSRSKRAFSLIEPRCGPDKRLGVWHRHQYQPHTVINNKSTTGTVLWEHNISLPAEEVSFATELEWFAWPVGICELVLVWTCTHALKVHVGGRYSPSPSGRCLSRFVKC